MAKVQGASTISQQYARNLYLEHDKTWKRKLNEAFYTIPLRAKLSEERGNPGRLFKYDLLWLRCLRCRGGKPVLFCQRCFRADETLAEASMLAGIPSRPSIYSPLASLTKAKQRQNIILAAMEENDSITKKEAEKANKGGCRHCWQTSIIICFEDRPVFSGCSKANIEI